MSDKLTSENVWNAIIILSALVAIVWYIWEEVDMFLDRVFDVMIGEDSEDY